MPAATALGSGPSIYVDGYLLINSRVFRKSSCSEGLCERAEQPAAGVLTD